MSLRLTYNIDDKDSNDNHYNCPVVAYYSKVLNRNVDDLHANIKFLYPYLTINNEKKLAEGIFDAFKDYGVTLSAARAAVKEGMSAYLDYMKRVKVEGKRALKYARENGRDIIILCGKPRPRLPRRPRRRTPRRGGASRYPPQGR